INAVNLATDSYSNDIMAQNKILTVSAQTLPVGLPIQCDILDSTLKITRLLWKTELLPMRRPRRDGNFFDIAFEGVCSLRDIEVAKEVEQINNEQIKNNMREMKRKLKGKSSPLAIEIYNYLDNVEVDNLGWWDPLASQVISDDSDLVLNLPRNVYHNFMEPLRRMKIEAPSSIKEICYAFVEGFDKDEPEILQQKWHRNCTWRETNEELADITTGILESLNIIWRNPAFEAQYAKTQSEGTYVTDVIIPLLHMSLKKLPIRNTAFISI
ncbi:13216_t:CDS:2, partial [Entrophospora sp. SA101]